MEGLQNIVGGAEVSGRTPDAEGDFILLGDKELDVGYISGKICEALKVISSHPDKDYFIISGGVVEGGTTPGTIKISAGVAISKSVHLGNAPAVVVIPALDNIALPSGWNDARQIWMIGQHDFKLNSTTRNHADGPSYHPQIDDTYNGDTSAIDGDAEDLFVDADPNSTESVVCWGSFTMTGTTYAEVTGERTRGFSVAQKEYVVSDQTSFNELFTRTSSQNYNINDNYTTVLFKKGIYVMSEAFTGGDTKCTIFTNNCSHLEFESGAYIDIEGNTGSIEINTDDCCLENVWLKADGTTLAYSNSFKLNASRVLYRNCKVSGVLTSSAYTAFDYSSTVTHDITARYIDCVVTDIDSTNSVIGFGHCQNISDCVVYGVAGSGVVTGFSACLNISSALVYNISGTTVTGFSNCENTSASRVEDITGSSSTYGFQGSGVKGRVSGCTVENISSTGGACYGFNQVINISGCLADNVQSSVNDSAGFRNCEQVSSCTADGVDYTGAGAYNAYGFIGCVRVSACLAEDIDDAGTGVSEGFTNCSYISSSSTPEASNTGNTNVSSSCSIP